MCEAYFFQLVLVKPGELIGNWLGLKYAGMWRSHNDLEMSHNESGIDNGVSMMPTGNGRLSFESLWRFFFPPTHLFESGIEEVLACCSWTCYSSSPRWCWVWATEGPRKTFPRWVTGQVGYGDAPGGRSHPEPFLPKGSDCSASADITSPHF